MPDGWEYHDNPKVVALVNAAMVNDVAKVVTLLKDKATRAVVNEKHKDNTALMQAALKGNGEIAAALIGDGQANVNVGDYFDGETAAMKAAQKNSAGVLRLLLESGKCDITLKHKQTGKTALDYAKRKGAAECVALLEEYQKDTPRFVAAVSAAKNEECLLNKAAGHGLIKDAELKAQRAKNDNDGWGKISDAEVPAAQDAQRAKNESAGHGKFLDAELKRQRATNESSGYGRISDADVSRQRSKNQGAGHGSICDRQASDQRAANDAAGRGQLTDAQVNAERRELKKRGYGNLDFTPTVTVTEAIKAELARHELAKLTEERKLDYAMALQAANELVGPDTVQYRVAWNTFINADGGTEAKLLAAYDVIAAAIQGKVDVLKAPIKQPDIEGVDQTDPKQKAKYVKALVKKFRAEISRLDAILEAVAKRFGGEYHVGPKKGMERLFEKAGLAYGGDLSRVMDYERRAIAFPGFGKSHMEGAAQALHDDSKIVILRSKNRFSMKNATAKETAAYRDHQLLVYIPGTKLIVEVQLHLVSTLAIKSKVAASTGADGLTGHDRYIQFRQVKEQAIALVTDIPRGELAKIIDEDDLEAEHNQKMAEIKSARVAAAGGSSATKAKTSNASKMGGAGGLEEIVVFEADVGGNDLAATANVSVDDMPKSCCTIA